MTLFQALENFSNTKKNNQLWLFYAVASAICYGLLSFFQYMILRKSPKLPTISMAIFIAAVQAIIGIILYFVFKITKLKKYETEMFSNYRKDIETLSDTKYRTWSVLGALLDFTGLVTLLIGYIGAPNPGLSDAISDTYLIPQAIITYFLFKNKINSLQFLGMGVAVIGIYLLSV